MPRSTTSAGVFPINTDGQVIGGIFAAYEYVVRPTLYLTSEVEVKLDEESDGSELTPYILVP